MLSADLRWFLVLARTEHVTDAAALLGIPQPTLSRMLARLESEVGAPLFDRAGRRLRLNRRGRALAHRFERAADELDAGVAEVRRLMDPDHGTIRFDFMHSLGTWLAPRLIRDYLELRPGVEFVLHQDSGNRLVERVLADEADVALVSPRPVDPAAAWALLTRQRLALAVPQRHRLADRDHVALTDATDETFAAVWRGFGLRTIFDRLTAQAGFTPRVAFESSELATVGGLVSAGLAVALFPLDDPYLDPEGARLIPLHPAAHREIGLAWRDDAPPLPPVDAFREFVTAHQGPETT